MQEFEVKFLEIDVGAVTNKLVSLGAKKVFDGEIKPSWFDTKDGKLKESKQLLRLRKKGDLVELSFKQKNALKDAKHYNETEVMVNNFENTKKILESLGFQEHVTSPKHRLSYKFNNLSFEFDTFPGIPTFLEIEAQSLDELNKAILLLGLDIKNAKPWSGRDVLRHYEKN